MMQNGLSGIGMQTIPCERLIVRLPTVNCESTLTSGELIRSIKELTTGLLVSADGVMAEKLEGGEIEEPCHRRYFALLQQNSTSLAARPVY